MSRQPQGGSTPKFGPYYLAYTPFALALFQTSYDTFRTKRQPVIEMTTSDRSIIWTGIFEVETEFEPFSESLICADNYRLEFR